MKKASNEQELVKACIEGDRKSQGELFNRFGKKLFSICLRYMGNYEKAQDELQDGFLLIFRTIHSFQWRGEGSLGAWLSRVMVNHCLQSLRKEKKQRFSTDIETVADEYVEAPQEETISEIPISKMLQLIETLPDGFRTVFNLYVFEEKSHKEIAQLLGIKEKSSSSQLHRAKALLAQKIRDYRGERNYEL
jgi:RNA polymerase sigma-70 factor (ECF subfamily)